MVWRIEYAESVQKDVRKLDAQERKRIRDFIEVKVALLDDPRSLGKPLSGGLSGLWRYRVGSYRVIANIEDRDVRILVVKIAHRKEVYRQ
ncbi:MULTISPECIES: type II toxin-antitoxin system RelE family toxin [Acidithiobacillus]|uniref:Type II toxin-antitoxin system RelE/ParE family toxin n=1 Tax=Acidithiobacillus ferridurans TaxID=1232575 RepID=A0A8X8K7I5_ACIFI|nr:MULTISPECIES: type II toxin-antitoxin system RelE/ParE family toxin [Acidithiobacillus]MDA8114900.1 type II toxin-antitoxin system RelE/ParE family toxin [Acidithiobacillus sp.]MBU2714929.1 type II toxin-antitoxin system RelE/ParE family toxin [Acidithiobacillus ferridurans]MBU2721866.1 type II toxin-antitoxin system RelE/ParE family toxin [Acidithiobacillus ferridurans]MBU2726966.1 type II toxin-antitoxin system RelE/ParE family toxin [Acidithiobacillus ferridurans]MBU2731245.1 type II tox